MEQTKEKVIFYEQPKVLNEIDIAIDRLEEIEGDRISRSSFIRRSIRCYINNVMGK